MPDAPADGVARLMHFVDARLAQLQMTKVEARKLGFPNPSTLAKVLQRGHQKTPTVRTLHRIDTVLAWVPGSAAVVLLGGFPLSLSAATESGYDVAVVTGEDVQTRLLQNLLNEVDRAQEDLGKLTTRVGQIRQACDHFTDFVESSNTT
ncbi:hypothetical protein [Mycolicibacterium sp.]|uniref:hypothetical protein n=1 Tax=Mycolicibacterium sp. TaxID=2320850 RepID=UPI0037C9C8CE